MIVLLVCMNNCSKAELNTALPDDQQMLTLFLKLSHTHSMAVGRTIVPPTAISPNFPIHIHVWLAKHICVVNGDSEETAIARHF